MSLSTSSLTLAHFYLSLRWQVVLKSDWGGWLVLASVVVFPSMFYLTQPSSIDTVETSDYPDSGANRAEISQQHKRESSPSLLSTRDEHADNNIDLAVESESDSDLTEMPDTPEYAAEVSEQEEYDPDAQESFLSSDIYDNPAAKGLSGSNISRPDFAVSNPVQEKNRTVSDTGSASVSAAVSETTVEVVENVIASDNSNLYLAEVQTPVQSTETKCPPVYMELNAYARNMRAAMGCDSD